MTIVFDVDSEKANRATHVESGLSVIYVNWETCRDGSVYYAVEYDGKTMPFTAAWLGTVPHMQKLVPADRKFAFNEENEIESRLDAQNKLVRTISSEEVDSHIYELFHASSKLKRIFLEVWHALVSRQFKNEKKFRVILHPNSFIPDPEGAYGAEYEVFPI